MAKGIGNGFPMAAVVTTAEIAQSLSAATHFNTFGGNPLACAIGSAVLDVSPTLTPYFNCVFSLLIFIEYLYSFIFILLDSHYIHIIFIRIFMFVLQVIEEENLRERCATIGTHFIQELGKLRDEYDIVGDVRGKGLMIGIEMVTSKDSKTPLPASSMAHIWETTKDLGLLVGKGGYYGNVSQILPFILSTKL